jgi:hypothetical protein
MHTHSILLFVGQEMLKTVLNEKLEFHLDALEKAQERIGGYLCVCVCVFVCVFGVCVQIPSYCPGGSARAHT